MNGSIGQDMARLIAQMEQIQKLINANNSGFRQMAAAIKNMGGLGPAMERASRAASGMHGAASGISQAMPAAAKHAEAVATAMERAASASVNAVRQQQLLLTGPSPMLALPAPYVSQSTAMTPMGSPYTPYGFIPPMAPLPGPRLALAGPSSGYYPNSAFTGGYYNPGGTAPGGGGGGFPPGVSPPGGYQMPPGGGGGAGPRARPGSHEFAQAAIGFGVAGHHLTGFLGDVFKAEKEYGQASYRLRASGWTDEQLREAQKAAFEAQRTIPGTSIVGALEAQQDLGLVMRHPGSGLPNTHEILEMLPTALRSTNVLAGFGKGGEIKGLLQAIQHGELRGIINNPEDIKRLLYFTEYLTMRSGGQAGPAALLQYARSSGVAGQSLSMDELFGTAAPLILSMGAARAGTGLRGFYQQFNAGKQSDAAVHMLRAMDLIVDPVTGNPFTAPILQKYKKSNKLHWVDDPHLNDYKKGMGQYQFPANAMRGWEMLHDGKEFEYIEKVLLPRIREYNVKMYGKTTPSLESTTVTALASRIPAGNMLADAFRLWPMIQGYRSSYEAAKANGSVDKDYALRYQLDPALRVTALSNSWNAFLISAGNNPAMDAAIKTIEKMTSVLNAMSRFAEQHPNVTAGAVEGAGVAGMGLVAAGAVSAAMWLGKPMIRVGKWLIPAGGGAAEGAAGAAGGAAGASFLGRALGGLRGGGAAAFVDFGLMDKVFREHYGLSGPDASPYKSSPSSAPARGGYLYELFKGMTTSAAGVADPGSAYHMPPGMGPRAMRIPGETGMPPTDVRQTVNQTVQQSISQTVHLTGNVTLDGKVVGSMVAEGVARGLNLPSNGPSGPDVRSTIPHTDTQF